MEDNKNKKVLNVPTLRFPEFNEVWKKTTLGNISNIKIYQPQTIKPLNFGKYKVFGANGYIGYYEEYNHNTNQVTISCRGEKSGTVNFVEPFVWITGNSMVLNLDKTSEIIKKFLYYELISNNVNYLITGSGQPQLTRDSLIQHKIYFPNIDEQTEIANFLSLIDKRIELQNKIIKDYELLKKLMNDRLIYKNENKVMLPLNEFATLKNGYAFKGNINFKDGKYPVITITNVTGDRLCNIKSINKVNHLPLDIQKHQILKSTDILISLTGNVGRVSYCGINNGLLNQRVGLLEIFDKQKIEYIFQALSNKKFEKRMISLAQGGSQLNLSKNDIEKYKMPLVSDIEINKISNLLMRYDLKILLGKNLLSNYKKVKKFLLMQLFI